MREVGEYGVREVDGRVAEMIGAAVLAGAYRQLIRECPETAAGFGGLAERHSRRVAALADEISAAVALAGPAAHRRQTL